MAQFNQGVTEPVGKVCSLAFTGGTGVSLRGGRGQLPWPGWRQLAQHVGPESGWPSRSEVATLGLHVARLPGVTAGQLGEAGSHFGPAVLGQRFSGRGDVTVRQSRENRVKSGFQVQIATGRAAGGGVDSGSGLRGMAAAWLGGKSGVEKWGGASTLSCELPVRQQHPAQHWGRSSGPAFKSTKDGSGPGCLLTIFIDLPAKAHFKVKERKCLGEHCI